MIVFEQPSPSTFQFANLWKMGTTFNFVLRQVDEDGDESTKTLEWVVPEPMHPYKGIKELIKAIDSIPFWRAGGLGSYLQIEPNNPLNQFEVTLTIQEP